MKSFAVGVAGMALLFAIVASYGFFRNDGESKDLLIQSSSESAARSAPKSSAGRDVAPIKPNPVDSVPQPPRARSAHGAGEGSKRGAAADPKRVLHVAVKLHRLGLLSEHPKEFRKKAIDQAMLDKLAFLESEYRKKHAPIKRQLNSRVGEVASKIGRENGPGSEEAPTSPALRKQAKQPHSPDQIVVAVMGTSGTGEPIDRLVRINPGDDEQITELSFRLSVLKEETKLQLENLIQE